MAKRHYLWRAVDQDDNVLDILVQSRRNKQAAKKFFRKLLKGLQYVPRVSSRISSRATARPSGRSCPGWNTARVAISTTAVRTRIGPRANANIACRGLSQRDMPSAFCPRMAPLPNTSDPRRHLLSASEYREEMQNRFESWAEITGTKRAA